MHPKKEIKMKTKIALKILAISAVVMLVVSCVMPCIAVDGLKDSASTDENLLRESVTGNRFAEVMHFYANATNHAHRMPSSPLPTNKCGIMEDPNASISNKDFVSKLIAPEGEDTPALDNLGNKQVVTPNVKVLQVSSQSTKQILFINVQFEYSITDTGWNGYSDLAAMLERMGFTIVEQHLNPITLGDLVCYDVVVFSPGIVR